MQMHREDLMNADMLSEILPPGRRYHEFSYVVADPVAELTQIAALT
jgi:hypothetical protein